MGVAGSGVRVAVEAGAPEFPVAFADPSHERLSWEWDDMHMPYALYPLAGDYVRALAAGMNHRYELLGGFPQRWLAAIWNGYAYFTVALDGTAEEQAEVLRRWSAARRAQIPVAGRWWRETALPELEALYAGVDRIDPALLGPDARAAAWDAAWSATTRAWELHFIAILGPYEVIDVLVDLYEQHVPDAAPGDGPRLIGGHGDELYAMEMELEALVAHAAANDAIAATLRASGPASREHLQTLDGGPAFVAALDAFLARHGHLGQAFDDLALPSWAEEPAVVIGDIAKRLDRTVVPAAERRARLLAEAAELEARARAAIADPEELARFDELLATAREIGPLTEGHNYWIDRKAQAHLRRLVTRVGRWLVREGALDDPDDVFLLFRDEVRDLLAAPSDRRALVAERRATLARQRAIRPPRVVGAQPEAAPPDRFSGPATVAAVAGGDPATATGGPAHHRADTGAAPAVELAGVGGSPGVVRATARVIHSPDDIERLLPGEIIVCPSSNPSWIPLFMLAGGLVTNTGGVLSHAAVVAREFGLPAVVGVTGATDRIPDGQQLEIDGTRGVVRFA